MSKSVDKEKDVINEKLSRNTYSEPQILADKIEDYFAYCDTEKKRYTMAGLVYFLGYSNRQAASDIRARKDPMYRWLMDRAFLYIEDQKNNHLLKPGQPTAGFIFDLKNNHGWKDKKDEEKSGPIFIFKSAINRVEKVDKVEDEGEFDDIA